MRVTQCRQTSNNWINRLGCGESKTTSLLFKANEKHKNTCIARYTELVMFPSVKFTFRYCKWTITGSSVWGTMSWQQMGVERWMSPFLELSYNRVHENTQSYKLNFYSKKYTSDFLKMLKIIPRLIFFQWLRIEPSFQSKFAWSTFISSFMSKSDVRYIIAS